MQQQNNVRTGLLFNENKESQAKPPTINLLCIAASLPLRIGMFVPQWWRTPQSYFCNSHLVCLHLQIIGHYLL